MSRSVFPSQIKWPLSLSPKTGIIFSEEILLLKSTPLLKGITTQDDGSYTITTQDLAEFPQNAILTFYVARAGYGISTNDSGEDYSLAGLTVNRADFKIQK